MALVPYEDGDGNQNGEESAENGEDIECEMEDPIELQEVDINASLITE